MEQGIDDFDVLIPGLKYGANMSGVRLDKWLWAARFLNTGLARDAIDRWQNSSLKASKLSPPRWWSRIGDRNIKRAIKHGDKRSRRAGGS